MAQRVLSQAADRWSAPQLAQGNLVVVGLGLDEGWLTARMSEGEGPRIDWEVGCWE